MEFITKINNFYDIHICAASALFELTNTVEVDIVSVSCEVSWSLDVEAREWGLKGIHPHVDKILAHTCVDIYHAGNIIENTEKVLEIPSDKISTEFDVFKPSHDLRPRTIEIDGTSLVTTVYF